MASPTSASEPIIRRRHFETSTELFGFRNGIRSNKQDCVGHAAKWQSEKTNCMTSEERRNLDLVIRLAVIIGHCNVLDEMIEEGSQQARRLALIRSIVGSAMKDLTEHQRRIGSIEAKSGISNPAPSTEPKLQPIENQQRKTRQKTPTPVESPVERPSQPITG
jgi:hypothetical protein